MSASSGPTGRHDDVAYAVGHGEREDAHDEERRRSDGHPESRDECCEDLPQQKLPRANRRREDRFECALSLLANDRVRREHRRNEDRKKQEDDRELSPDECLADLEHREACELGWKGRAGKGYSTGDLAYGKESSNRECGNEWREDHGRQEQGGLKAQLEPLLLENDERLFHL